MNKESAAIRLAAARRAIASAEDNCPHWDYEHESDASEPCCLAAEQARQELRNAHKQYHAVWTAR